MGNLMLGIGVGFGLINVVLTILIMVELGRRNIPTNILLARLYMIKYVNQYKKATVSETGKPGVYYYAWIGSINLALVFAVAGLIIIA